MKYETKVITYSFGSGRKKVKSIFMQIVEGHGMAKVSEFQKKAMSI